MAEPMVELGKFCDIRGGGKLGFSSADFVSDGVPAYGAAGLNGRVARVEYRRPGVVLSSIGARCGKCFYAESNWTTLANTQAILPDLSMADPRFLWYQLNDEKSWHRSGTAQPFIKPADVKSRRVYLPTLEAQRRIADVLDRAAALRAKRREALAHRDDLTQSIFVDMFGDPVRNPHQLPVRTLQDIGTLDRGVSKHRPRNDPILLGGPYPLIQTGDVASSHGIVRSFGATYSEAGLRQSKLWPAGVLLITIAANIGKTAILAFPACFPDSVVAFTSDRATTLFIRTLFHFMQKLLEEAAPMSAQKNINLALLRALPVPVPSMDEREHFARRILAVETARDEAAKHLDQLDALFAALQQRAFAGQL